MTASESLSIILFDSTAGTLLAENILNEKGFLFKIIPVPRHLSSDCGLCIRISETDIVAARAALAGRVDIAGLFPLEEENITG